MDISEEGEPGDNRENGESSDSGKRDIKTLGSKTIKLDRWQREVLDTKGDICLRAGRQVGKSTIISIKAGEFAIKNRNKSVMIISAVERQAYLLFAKVLAYIFDNYRSYIKAGKDRPTKTEIKLKNGSVIRCLPTGNDGLGIRGYTVDLLIADEAAFIGEDVWPAVTPMLSTTGGTLILISTPLGKSGFFYSCWIDETGRFTKFHINAEDIAEQREEPQRTNMKNDHILQRNMMTKMQYAQEYLGEFVDELRRLFPDDLIKRACILKRKPRIQGAVYYLGVDVARMGDDESTFEVIIKHSNEKLEQVDHMKTEKTLITDTVDRILLMESRYIFSKIYIDDGGVGAGVFDMLLREDPVKRKIVAINNAKRSLDRDETRHKRTMKEDLYMNFKSLLEKGYLKLLDEDDVVESLRSIQFEYKTYEHLPKRLLIFGEYSHIVEGLIRAAWGWKDKSLNIWVRSL